jgi:hypothetical protein
MPTDITTDTGTGGVMRYLLALFLFALAAPVVTSQSPDVGVVTHRIRGCDYFLVEAKKGYDLLEWYGGYDPDKGDTIAGRFESYGFHSVVDTTADEDLRIYTEDYQLSKGDALDKLAHKCE